MALLWLSALSSASLLPGSSEIVMGGLVVSRLYAFVVMVSRNQRQRHWFFNQLVVGWSSGALFWHRRWFPATPEQMQRAEVWMRKIWSIRFATKLGTSGW